MRSNDFARPQICFGQLDLALGRERERHEALGLLHHRLDDGGVRVAEELDRVVVDEVDPLHAVHVGDAAAVGFLRVDRIGRELGEAARAAAGEHRACSRTERGGARVRIGIRHGQDSCRGKGSQESLSRCRCAHPQRAGARMRPTRAAGKRRKAVPDCVVSRAYGSLSGNNPGSHREASLAGKARRSGARELSEARMSRPMSAALTRRAWRSPVPSS